MTRELLPPILSIVLLVNVGVITYVIGSRRARQVESPRPGSGGTSEMMAGGPWIRRAATQPPSPPAPVLPAPVPSPAAWPWRSGWSREAPPDSPDMPARK